MINIQKYKDLGKLNISWLRARYHFSFSNYYTPKRTAFGKLLVINDDVVKSGGGFETHPHKDMEIITYIRSGAITHKDSQGNIGRTEAGDVQVMSAGTGIYHSEHNKENEDTRLYQIWIEPHTKGVKPRWDTCRFPKKTYENSLPLIVSGRKKDKTKKILHINQYASVHGGKIKEGTSIIHTIKDQAYLLVSKGQIDLDGNSIETGDGAEITDLKNITITAKTESEVIIIDVPK